MSNKNETRKSLAAITMYLLFCSATITSLSAQLSETKNIDKKIYFAGKIAPLTVGDSVPPIEITDILYYKKGKLNLHELKGKLVILDFWTYSCSPCISAMPKMDSLQKLFGDQICIIPVLPLKYINEKTKPHLDSFWKANKYTRNTTLAVIMDTILRKYFPLDGVPYEVWIDKNGIVRGLTKSEYVNKKEIASLLEGKIPNWPIANKFLYNSSEPFFVVNGRVEALNSIINKNMNYSVSRSYIPRLQSVLEFIRDTTNVRFITINMPVHEMYNFVLFKKAEDLKQPIKLRVAQTFQTPKLQSEYKETWLSRYTYCYEGTYPAELSNDKIFELILSDLDKYFMVKRTKLKESENCIIITDMSSSLTEVQNQSTLTSKSSIPGLPTDNASFSSVNELILYLNRNSSIIHIDETKHQLAVELVFPRSAIETRNYSIIKRFLRQYGLDIINDTRQIEYQIIDKL